MLSVKILISQHFLNYLKPLNSFPTLVSSTYILSPSNKTSGLISLLSQKPITISTQSDCKKDSPRRNSGPDENSRGQNKKALDVLFKEAVGLIPRGERSESENENEDGEFKTESGELKKRLRDLELEVRELIVKRDHEMTDRNSRGKSGGTEGKKKETEAEDGESKSKVKRLYALFNERNNKEEKVVREREELVVKEFSSDMEEFLRHLYDEGYFKDANFLPGRRFDVSSFENGYARDFLKFAAERFGKDNQEIAKWLSGSDLKTVAVFGCPSLARRSVFAAKRLRTFFEIPENTVCSKCILRESCNFKNQSVWKGNAKKLDLNLLMRLLIVYAMEAHPPELVLSDEVKASVSRVLKDVMKLSKSCS